MAKWSLEMPAAPTKKCFDEQTERDADRMLVVIYRLSGGNPNVVIPIENAYGEIARECIFTMTDEQFECYRQRALTEVKTTKEMRH